MKRHQFATISISVIAAILLWAIATWLEDDSRWTGLAEKVTPDMSMEQPRPDTPVRANTSIASCEVAEESMRRTVNDAQYCSNDTDCTLFDYGYPIECMTSVAKSEITALRLEYRVYEESCAYRVYYDCPSGDTQREAVCRNNRCEVELVTIDALKDQTLEYLGIE
jgi:hypothetical protein